MSEQLPLDRRTVHAAELRQRIAAGAPLAPDVTVTYVELEPQERAACVLDLQHSAITGRPLHPHRRATRTMYVRVRSALVAAMPVCGHCGLADFVVVTRAELRAVGEL